MNVSTWQWQLNVRETTKIAVQCSHSELLELQTLTNGHAVHVNLQSIYFEIYFLFLQHLSIEKVTESCFWLWEFIHRKENNIEGKVGLEKLISLKRERWENKKSFSIKFFYPCNNFGKIIFDWYWRSSIYLYWGFKRDIILWRFELWSKNF